MIWSIERALAAAAPLLFAVACQPLSAIPDDVCGNRVVEPERNEDCDEASDRCYPPGDPHECRFRCALTADCPAGLACGLDGICREPLGALELVHEAREGVDALAVADFDADGQLDLMRTSTDAVRIDHYSPSLISDVTFTVGRNGDELPRAVDVDGDGGADLVVPTPIGLGGANGLGVYLSDPSRTFTPASFASFPIPAKAIRGVVVDGIYPQSEKEIVALSELDPALGGGVALFGISTRSAQDARIAAPPLPHPSDVVGLASLRYDTLGCEWVVVAEAGASELTLIRPCKLDPEAIYVWNLAATDTPATMTIPLADATVIDPDATNGVATFFEPLAGVEAVFTGDFDGNGLEDVAVTTLNGAGNDVAVHVSYQTRLHAVLPGRGFHSQPPPAVLPGPGEDPLVVDGTTSEVTMVAMAPCKNQLGLPLAVADINGDGKVDVAYRRGTAVSVVGPYYDIRCDQNWRRAAVGDLDGSGTADFVGARADEDQAITGLEVLLSAADGVLTQQLIATASPVDFLVVDNFDGDGADDIAFVERAVEGELQPFYAVFGQATGGFAEPKPLGALPNVTQVVAGRSSGADAAAEIVAVSALDGVGDDGSLLGAAGAVLIGSSAREILAPYTVAFDVIEGGNIQRTLTQSIGLVAGRFNGPGLALVTRDGLIAETAGSTRPLRLVFVPFSAETLLGAPLAGIYEPGGADEHFACAGCFLAAIDAGDDDRLWSFGTEGVFYHPMTDAGVGAPVELDVPAGWGDGSCGDLVPRYDFGAAQRDRDPPIARDIDGDGHRDLLVFAKRCDAGALVREVVVFFNDGAGALSFGRTMRITGTDACRIEGAALMQLDAEPSLEIVVGVDAAPGASCERRLLRFPAAVGASSSLEDGAPLAEGMLAIPHRPAVMVAGDLDGDGVDDLAVGDFGGFALFRGLAVRP